MVNVAGAGRLQAGSYGRQINNLKEPDNLHFASRTDGVFPLITNTELSPSFCKAKKTY